MQKELKTALELLDEFPPDEVFLLPVRLEDCRPEDEKLRFIHWADVFPFDNEQSYRNGLAEIVRAMKTMCNCELPGESAEKNLPDTVSNSLGMNFVYIPPGEFLMGSPEDEPGRFDNEKQHRVILTQGFYMQITPVTVGQWRRFVKESGYKSEAETGDGSYIWTGNEWEKKKGYYWDKSGFKQNDNHPVTCVSWNDAMELIRWLKDKEKRRYGLPSEAQWEYACRAGTQTPFYYGGCLSTDQANYDGNYSLEGCPKGEFRKRTIPAGSLQQPNAWGLHDMHGNVWEWCQDWYGDYPSGSVTDPADPSDGAYRVVRGGGWDGNARGCRSALRSRVVPGYRYDNLGFRLVLLPGQE